MIKKIGLIATSVLCLAFAQSSVSAKPQSFSPLYKQSLKQNYRQVYVDYSPYAENLRDQVADNWNPQTKKRHMDATVLVRIHKDGAIENIKIQKSSFKKNFDYAIVDSIKSSVPFDSLPKISQTEYKDIQLNFVYNKIKGEKTAQKYITANVSNLDGFDDYIQEVSNVISKKIDTKSYFCKKDIVLEMNIDKSGKLVYAKVKKSHQKDDFNSKEFNRNTLNALKNVSFPAIPSKMGVNHLTVDYRVLTQRERLFRNYVFDYVLNGFRTGAESYYIQCAPNL